MEAGFRTVTNGKSKIPHSRWEISLGSWPRRIAAIVIALIVAAAVEGNVWGRCVAAWITRDGPRDPAVYERAARLDPRNAAYHFKLGQLYNSADNLDVERARTEYRQAAGLNPRRGAYWLELAKFEESEGNAAAARESIGKALEADPQYAQTHWAAANFHIRQGALPEADAELRQTVERDAGYMMQALDLAWRFYEDPEKILATHVPDTRATNLIALSYFITNGSGKGAGLAWDRLRRFETVPAERFPYIDYLVSHEDVAEAWRVFQFPKEGPPFFNGSFESEPVNGGFDWRVTSTRDASVRRDSGSARLGLACLAVTFSGKENIDFGSQVNHWIAVEKGRSYTLSFWMRTEGITTNEGVFVEVDGQASEKQLGTNYWKQFTIPFTASRDLVTVRLRREPSMKFDNLLKGRVWLDGFELVLPKF